jgi:NAD(P)-dependent dehydrogenase (short-subunit alcohol dehydrogenase family)
LTVQESEFSSFDDSDEAIWNETINVNLRGTFFCCRSALPALRDLAAATSGFVTGATLQIDSGATAGHQRIIQTIRFFARAF